jgi:phage terminase small subunit
MELAISSTRRGTPAAVHESVAAQIMRMRDAKARVGKEGAVVRDMKGSVIPHPAIKIESDACDMLNKIIKTWSN